MAEMTVILKQCCHVVMVEVAENDRKNKDGQPVAIAPPGGSVYK